MDATKGAKVFNKCKSCHNTDNGGAHGTGPNLWNVVGAQAGGKAGFKYSAAMTGSGLTWDYETLNAYLAKPTKYLKGTNMNFIGLKKPVDRAAVIEYLRVASGNALPKPQAAMAEAMTTEEVSMEKMDAEKMDEATMVSKEDAMMDAEKMSPESITDPAKKLMKDAKEKVLEKVDDGH